MTRLLLIFFVMLCVQVHGQKGVYLPTKIKPFTNGELLEYKVVYKWGLVYTEAGWVNFSVESERYYGKQAYHLIGEGGSKSNWDWFFKVRDKYESIVDSSYLRPYRYIRNSNDGGHWVFNDNIFDDSKKVLYSTYKDKKHPQPIKDTVKTNFLTFDPITMIYYARSLDFSLFKPGDVIPIALYLDGVVYYKHIRYLGKETITTDLGTFSCIKIKPELIPGTIFKEGDEMTVWVTDDENKIPVLVETPILVGTIKAQLKSYTGIRKPLVSVKKP